MSTSAASSDLPRRARRLSWPLGLSLGIHAGALLLGVVVVTAQPSGEGAPAPEPIVAAFVESLEPLRADADVIEDGLASTEDPRLLDTPVSPPDARDEPAAACELPACEPSEDVAPPPLTLPEIPLVAARSRPPRPEPAPALPEVVQAPSPPQVRRTPPARAARPRPARPRLVLTYRPDVRRYYPEDARRRGIQGTTLVRIDVDARGAVAQAQVARSSGSTLLDQHALRFARDLRFAPGAPGAALQPVAFTLD